MENKLIKIATIFLLTFLYSCGNTIKDESDYYLYLEEKGNGIAKSKEILDVEIKVKYLPSEYLCYQDMRSEQFSTELKDSIMEYYKYNTSFLVSIGPSENTESEFDITKVGVANYSEFSQRAEILNFQMKEYFTLIADGKEYKPVFCEMENVYGLTLDRKFNLIFSPELEKNELVNAKKLVLKYNDELFNTGINKFTFQKENIDNVPKIAFWENR